MVQDVWPDSIFASGFLTGRARPVAEGVTARFVDASYKMATRLTALSPGMRQLLMGRGVPGDKIDVIYNWADEGLYSEPLKVPSRDRPEPLHLLYAGSLGPPQGLDVVIETMSRFAKGEVRLSLAGAGIAEPQLRALADSRPDSDIRFLGRLSPGDLRQGPGDCPPASGQPSRRPALPDNAAQQDAGADVRGRPNPCVRPRRGRPDRHGGWRWVGGGRPVIPALLNLLFGKHLSGHPRHSQQCGRAAREHYFTDMGADLNGRRLAAALRRAAEEGRLRRGGSPRLRSPKPPL